MEESVNDSLVELVDLLRENYWYLDVGGARAMADLWSEIAENRNGFEETAREIGVTLNDFVKAASLLGEWMIANDVLYKSPMEQSVEIRTEKLAFPEGPR